MKVRFYWDDGLDCDNHAVLGKAFLDAMKGYILPDDNRKWVKMVSHEFWDGGAIKVEIMPGGQAICMKIHVGPVRKHAWRVLLEPQLLSGAGLEGQQKRKNEDRAAQRAAA